MTVFTKRYPSRKEFPETAGYYDTNVGRVFYVNEKFDRTKKYYPIWWLQEIELPNDNEIQEVAPKTRCVNQFWNGANFVLNKLKGG